MASQLGDESCCVKYCWGIYVQNRHCEFIDDWTGERAITASDDSNPIYLLHSNAMGTLNITLAHSRVFTPKSHLLIKLSQHLIHLIEKPNPIKLHGDIPADIPVY